VAARAELLVERVDDPEQPLLDVLNLLGELRPERREGPSTRAVRANLGSRVGNPHRLELFLALGAVGRALLLACHLALGFLGLREGGLLGA
jgi:hypothetical protein